MKIYADARLEVYVEPIDILNKINIVDSGDWIIKEKDKYYQMTNQSAGTHSFEAKVCEVSLDTYNAFMAKKILIEYLRINK
jgi:hypothetical protein